MTVYDYKGISYETHREVYEPAEDTFLLAESVNVDEGERVLEVGCGSGLVSLVLAMRGARVVAVDANPDAVALAKSNAKLNSLNIDVRESTFFDAVIDDPFDTVLFNPPYLPTAKDERIPGHLNLAFDGGLSGNEVIFEFIDRLFEWNGRTGRMPRLFLLLSSLNDIPEIGMRLKKIGYQYHEVVARDNHFFEELTVHLFR